VSRLDKKEEFLAILLAAGRGARFGQEIPKQFVEFEKNLKKTTAIEESFKILSLFAKKIILTLPDFSFDEKDLINFSQGIVRKLKLLSNRKKIVLKIITGGKTRLDSVKLASEHLRERGPEKYILIHDAARCFCHFRDLKNLKNAVQKKKAVILAKKATDTIKIANKNLKITKNLKRSQVWHAQTPQAFEINLLKKALRKNLSTKDCETITDDASLFEAIREPVYLLESKYSSNQKLTYKEDLKL